MSAPGESTAASLQWGPTCSVGRSGGAARGPARGAGCASMGPDLFGREIGSVRSRWQTGEVGFNGARPVRSGDRRLAARPRHAGGAASMGPDLFGREIVRAGMIASTSETTLQWGPTCSVGRSEDGAGTLEPPLVCFNGARPVRSGDRIKGTAEAVGSMGASMGPDLFGREIGRGSRPRWRLWRPASMGPDLFGREIDGGKKLILKSILVLQWGPTCSVGRSSPDRTGPRAATPLQWGPTCSVGRSAPLFPAFGGPRVGFNGARPVRSGDRPRGLHPQHPLRPASMGPDLFGREIGCAGRPSRACPIMLQWGPTCSVGRSHRGSGY